MWHWCKTIMEVFSLEVVSYVNPKCMKPSGRRKKCLKLKTKPATELSSHRLYQCFWNCGHNTGDYHQCYGSHCSVVYGLSKKNQRIKCKWNYIVNLTVFYYKHKIVIGGALNVLNYISWHARWSLTAPVDYKVFFEENIEQPAIKILPTGLQCTLPVQCFTQTLYLFARWNRRTEQFLHDFDFHIINIETEHQPM
jgi:hypothetical protein